MEKNLKTSFEAKKKRKERKKEKRRVAFKHEPLKTGAEIEISVHHDRRSKIFGKSLDECRSTNCIKSSTITK
jgi:hypothetical protein